MYAVIFHAHQKLDRVSHRHLKKLIKDGDFFPSIKQIVSFDGPNGPDSAKLKRQSATEQPWHFINPHDINDTKLPDQIDFHYRQLVESLKKKDEVRSAFEAAWLAHALVDGLTPAHHYPYEEELEKLRGEARHTRKGLVGRLYVKGETLGQSVVKSFKLIGPKGLITTHGMFEAGAYAIIVPLRLTQGIPTPDEIIKIENQGVVKNFKELAREIAEFDIYGRYYINGWTRSLSLDIRQQLAPRMVRMVTLAWYTAIQEAARS